MTWEEIASQVPEKLQDIFMQALAYGVELKYRRINSTEGEVIYPGGVNKVQKLKTVFLLLDCRYIRSHEKVGEDFHFHYRAY